MSALDAFFAIDFSPFQVLISTASMHFAATCTDTKEILGVAHRSASDSSSSAICLNWRVNDVTSFTLLC